MIRASVDRVEGEWVILVPESGPTFQVPLTLFPGLKEKDVVRMSIEKDELGQKEAEERISNIRKGLNRVEL